MPRPSRNTDQRLIRAALELLPETGFSGLKLRKVAQRAGVNPGMFYYHFKSKHDFSQRVIKEFYEKFYARLVIESSRGESPEAHLHKAAGILARFARDHRKLLLALGRDILDGNQQVIRFLEDNFHRHARLILQLLLQCQKRGSIARIPAPAALAALMGLIAGPSIIMAILERTKLRQPYSMLAKIASPFLLADKAVDQRLELAFKALAPASKMPVARRRT